MTYLPLQQILDSLDQQQREQWVELTANTSEVERRKRREARQELARMATVLIERSWLEISPRMEAFTLEREAGMSTELLQDYITSLAHREAAYAWSWVRSRMNGPLMQWIEEIVPRLLAQDPDLETHYLICLRSVYQYGFRSSPLHHIKAGYHTALGVACKWYGSTLENLPAGSPPPQFSEELRQFASFSMSMLARTDGYLWDSAGAAPMDIVMAEGGMLLTVKDFPHLDLTKAPDYGVRLGCPALRARSEQGPAAFSGIICWVETLFTRHLLECGTSDRPLTVT